MEAAIGSGNLECVKYLMSYDCQIDCGMEIAAEYGHLDILLYFHQLGENYNVEVINQAALNGHLKIVEYLHGRKASWNQKIFQAGIKSGNLKVVKYLKKK